jgi:hypothetical protein
MSTATKVKWKVDVDRRLAASIEHRLMDPMLRKPRYGLRSKLINTLLERYLAENPVSIDAPPITEAEINALITPETPYVKL